MGSISSRHWLYLILFFIIVLLEIYLWAVALYETDAIFKGILIKLIQVFRNFYFKFSLVYSEFFIFIIGACLLFFIGYFLSNLIALFFCALTSFSNFVSISFFIGFPLMIFFVLFFLLYSNWC